MILAQWAERWGVPQDALQDLCRLLGTIPELNDRPLDNHTGEHEVLQQVMLEASKRGGRLWRNNCGGMPTESGGFLRYGLANTSAAINRVIKSSDLVGILPVKIKPADVGKIIGQFICRETKRPGWKFNPNSEREQAQLRWIQLIVSLGGDAAFTTKIGSIP